MMTDLTHQFIRVVYLHAGLEMAASRKGKGQGLRGKYSSQDKSTKASARN